MKSFLISIPASIIVGLLVGKLALTCLHMPTSPGWLILAVIACSLLLLRRSVYELGFVGIIAITAELHLRGMGSLDVSEDILLAIIVSVILLPTALSILEIHNPLGKTS